MKDNCIIKINSKQEIEFLNNDLYKSTMQLLENICFSVKIMNNHDYFDKIYSQKYKIDFNNQSRYGITRELMSFISNKESLNIDLILNTINQYYSNTYEFTFSSETIKLLSDCMIFIISSLEIKNDNDIINHKNSSLKYFLYEKSLNKQSHLNINYNTEISTSYISDNKDSNKKVYHIIVRFLENLYLIKKFIIKINTDYFDKSTTYRLIFLILYSDWIFPNVNHLEISLDENIILDELKVLYKDKHFFQNEDMTNDYFSDNENKNQKNGKAYISSINHVLNSIKSNKVISSIDKVLTSISEYSISNNEVINKDFYIANFLLSVYSLNKFNKYILIEKISLNTPYSYQNESNKYYSSIVKSNIFPYNSLNCLLLLVFYNNNTFVNSQKHLKSLLITSNILDYMNFLNYFYILHEYLPYELSISLFPSNQNLYSSLFLEHLLKDMNISYQISKLKGSLMEIKDKKERIIDILIPYLENILELLLVELSTQSSLIVFCLDFTLPHFLTENFYVKFIFLKFFLSIMNIFQYENKTTQSISIVSQGFTIDYLINESIIYPSIDLYNNTSNIKSIHINMDILNFKQLHKWMNHQIIESIDIKSIDIVTFTGLYENLYLFTKLKYMNIKLLPSYNLNDLNFYINFYKSKKPFSLKSIYLDSKYELDYKKIMIVLESVSKDNIEEYKVMFSFMKSNENEIIQNDSKFQIRKCLIDDNNCFIVNGLTVNNMNFSVFEENYISQILFLILKRKKISNKKRTFFSLKKYLFPKQIKKNVHLIVNYI